MKKSDLKFVFSVFGVLILFLFTGCGTQNELSKARKSGIKMVYNFSEETVQYKQTQDIDQNIDAFGQEIKIKIIQDLDFEMKKNTTIGNNSKLALKVLSAKMGISANGQNMDPNLTELDGKEFHMTVSPKGKEVDTHEADEIVFQITPDEKSNLGMVFNSIFPDLPESIVKIGDNWENTDSISYIESGRYSIVVIDNIHTLNEFIEIDGKNCAEITTTMKGYLKVKSYSQGAELYTDANIIGTGTWYFDIKGGVFIKNEMKGKSVGKVKMDMGEMDFGREFHNVTELIN